MWFVFKSLGPGRESDDMLWILEQGARSDYFWRIGITLYILAAKRRFEFWLWPRLSSQYHNITKHNDSVSTALGVIFVPSLLNDANLIFDSNLVFHLGFVGIFFQLGNMFAVDLNGHLICYTFNTNILTCSVVYFAEHYNICHLICTTSMRLVFANLNFHDFKTRHLVECKHLKGLCFYHLSSGLDFESNAGWLPSWRCWDLANRTEP